MIKETKPNNVITCALCFFTMIFFVGCSNIEYSYKQRDPEKKQELKEKICVQDLLVTSEREGVDIQTERAHILIKESKTTPDSESVQAITERVVEGVVK